MSEQKQLDELKQLLGKDLKSDLQALNNYFSSDVIFSTSFSEEDQIITHQIFSNNLDIKVFTLDTGRLFTETYSVWSRTTEKYQKPIHAFYPDAIVLQQFVTEKGANSFYESVDNRKQCCHIRKVEPLYRALLGNKLWITGIRAEHSPNRNDMQQLEWDEANDIFKYHPLLYWSTNEVKQFIQQHQIPYNALHDKGFVSIGCSPCTRAINPGEDFRAGRWWWEDASKKECGLHMHTETIPSAVAKNEGS